MAAMAVASHEREHVVHNAKAAEEQGMTARSTVAIHMAACPDCGRLYVSGGTTTPTYTPKQETQGTGAEDNKGNFVDTMV